MKSPAELSYALTEIVAKECKCEAAWTQHPGPLTSHEVYMIRARIEVLLRELNTEVVNAEIDSRHRLKMAGLTR